MRALPIGLLLVLWTQRVPRCCWWWRSTVLGTLNIGVFFAQLFVAAYQLRDGVAATMGALQPFLVVVLAWPMLGDRPRRRTLITASAGAIGVGLLVLGPTVRLDALGVVAAVGGTFAMASGTMLTKRWGRPAPLLAFTAWQLVAGGALLALLALVLEGPPPQLTLENTGGFVYLGVVNTGMAYVLWFRGIERRYVAVVTCLALLSPVVAVLLGFLVLRQTLSLVQLGGVLLVLGSIITAQRMVRAVNLSSAGVRQSGAPQGEKNVCPSST